MPITLNCSCGKTLRVADEHAGKRVKCPACNAVIAPAPPEPAFEVVEDAPRQLAAIKTVAKPRNDEDDDDGNSYGMTKSEKTSEPPKKTPNFRKRADSDDDDHPSPRPKKRRSARQAGAQAGADAGKRIGYMVGGAALLLIGGVVAYFAWENGTRGLIFGIILAISGLVTLGQGITGNIDDDE